MHVLHAALPNHDGYLARALGEAGHVVETAQDLPDLLLAACGGGYDALLVEVGEPGEVPVARLADAAGRGVLLLVADRASAAERAQALRDGADACFLRPVHFIELEARLSALSRLAPEAAARPEGLSLDPAARSARVGARELVLSRREFALLDYLAAHAGEPVTAEQILEHVWGEAGEGGPERVRSALARLRGKMTAAFGEDPISNVRGHGYALAAKMKQSSSG